MRLRNRLRVVLALLVAAAGLSLAAPGAPAAAVCGGGAPGEPCHCPGEVKVLKWTLVDVSC